MRVLLAGLCTVDLVQRVDELPAPGQKVASLSVRVAAGGPATNAAVTVAALGGEAVLVTALGAHPLASLARADLDACGVRVHDVAAGALDPPAVSAVAVRERDGERTVVSRNAGSFLAELGSAELAEATRADAVLVDGHHPELAMATARAAKAEGIPLVVDAGSWKPVFAELFPLADAADIIACSAQFDPPEGTVPAAPSVVATAGAAPVRWWRGGRCGEVPVPRVAAKDTLGAGDVWHGALVSRIGTLPLVELIEFANEVAAERVRHVGPRSWIAPVRAKMGVR
ncbi:ribokinase [Prauserella marina]|uniref:Sugar or nucleoside kinase, ribokinase family n=1 Tax=Prauserella marina TaxID=530584 RepID=A0A222VXG6_9PSEU|nr:PfkB family carbohydrate kinase [Prauserella marina]ASR38666.1 ribokinase [Prauserella marina]PWV81999.1 sugar/nucleoside kinase (ribokinase family) [Prauserella marina]SDD17090.1 Sugar or nucleoside kinase, ribokinase family [Prauserella marina]